MPKTSRGGSDAEIDKIRKLYNRAKEHSLYFNEEEQSSRNLEAFLMLSILLEGVLTLLGLNLLEKYRDKFGALYKKRKVRYGIDNAINDIYILEKITIDEFNKLEKFKSDRNKCIHGILKKKNSKDIEKYTKKLFSEHEAIFESIIEKLEKEL